MQLIGRAKEVIFVEINQSGDIKIENNVFSDRYCPVFRDITVRIEKENIFSFF
jgi:hypothetical protein